MEEGVYQATRLMDAGRITSYNVCYTKLLRAERRATDFHLDDSVASIDIALHLILQRRVVFAGIIITSGGIDEDPPLRSAVAISLGQQLEQWLLLDFGDSIPDRHIDGAHSDPS